MNGNIDIGLNPYRSKTPLTPTEVLFYSRLVEALPDYIVLAQVQLQSFIRVHNQAELHVAKRFYAWQNPLAQQSVDYLVCRKGDFAIVAAVELDDKSHNSTSAKKRDEKKNRNIAAAGITLIRWHAERMPSIAEIRQSFNADQVTLHINSDIRLFEKPKAGIGSSLLGVAILGLTLVVAINIISHGLLGSAQIEQPDYKVAEPHKKSVVGAPIQSVPESATPAQVIQQKSAEENEARRDRAWDTYYKQSDGCITGKTSIVVCGNEYIRAKQAFDARWLAESH